MGGDREDEEPTDADVDLPDEPDPESSDPAAASEDEGNADGESETTDDDRSDSDSVEETATEDNPDGTSDDAGSIEEEKPAEPVGFDRFEGMPRPSSGPNAPDDEDATDSDLETLQDIGGVGEAKARALREAGYETVDDVRAASEDELVAVDGFGDALVARVKDEVGDLDPIEDEADGASTEMTVADDEASTETKATDGAPAPAGADPAPTEDEGSMFTGPDSDEEMPLTAHIEEMIKRLAIVVAIAGVVSLVTFPFAERLINFLWYNIMPGVPSDIARPRLYGVLELVFTKLKVASLAGLLVALPALVYETYQFMRPGLYPHERRYYLAAVPASLVLALVGVSFAYFVVLPAIFAYFLTYSQDVATIGFALGRTFDLILVLMGYLALVFQIPLFIMLAMMMGVVTRKWLAGRRLLFWGAFLGISFLFSPDPTGMAPIIIALTMVVLFEGTLLLTKWAGRE